MHFILGHRAVSVRDSTVFPVPTRLRTFVLSTSARLPSSLLSAEEPSCRADAVRILSARLMRLRALPDGTATYRLPLKAAQGERRCHSALASTPTVSRTARSALVRNSPKRILRAVSTGYFELVRTCSNRPGLSARPWPPKLGMAGQELLATALTFLKINGCPFERAVDMVLRRDPVAGVFRYGALDIAGQ